MAFRNPPRREPSSRRWGRWLGGPDSWRRIVVTGATAGVTLAFVAALIAALVGGGGGSLNKNEPTVAPPAAGGSGAPTQRPAFDTPTQEIVVADTPTREPLLVNTPTEALVEPTDTPVLEKPTAVPTVEGGG